MPYTDYNQVLQDLADNIREVNGSTASIRFVDMPDLIDGFASPKISLAGVNIQVQGGLDSASWRYKLIPCIGDTSGMTDMSYMCRNIGNNDPFNPFTLDLSHFDTSNVTNMRGMFSGLYDVSSINLSSFDTSNVTNMAFMFSELHSYKGSSLDLSHFDTSNVTDMNHMFSNIFGFSEDPLMTLDVTGWDVSKVTDFEECFSIYSSAFRKATLTELDLSGWNTSNATNMTKMFGGSRFSKMWIPSTFVATGCPTGCKPFETSSGSACDVYTDAASAVAQGWGTIDSTFTVHYNSTHTDYENA